MSRTFMYFILACCGQDWLKSSSCVLVSDWFSCIIGRTQWDHDIPWVFPLTRGVGWPMCLWWERRAPGWSWSRTGSWWWLSSAQQHSQLQLSAPANKCDCWTDSAVQMTEQTYNYLLHWSLFISFLLYLWSWWSVVWWGDVDWSVVSAVVQ